MRQVPIAVLHAVLILIGFFFLTQPAAAGTHTFPAAPGSMAPGVTYASLQGQADPAFLFGVARQAGKKKTLRVRAMAYTCSVGRKRKPVKHAARGAWGDMLTPGKAVAVSHDLLEQGLDHGDVITIEGLPGEYRVLDVMHGRHKKSIDIFYGDDQCGARDWGKRTLRISWQAE